ncbi:helicase-related protein [Aminobacter aminovorans]|uniref:helicase-related protein n=1 Tax=Aminobacter aminovorans TaxID=83263 RepID=UPI0028659546|nr:helicase-related protein [Aminobacter aminovorans]MDR7225228.1 hypothetical protein [Aminobacter aminovorans]
MHQKFEGWQAVATRLEGMAERHDDYLNAGQRASLRYMAQRLPHSGLILADEVGMGKTRIAVALARAVIECGGRVAIIIPPGLGAQWQDELRKDGIVGTRPHLRSLWAFLDAWRPTSGETLPPPWFDEKLLLISQNLANWRLGSTSARWRCELLPAIYAHWQRKTVGRFPYGFWRHPQWDERVLNAAESIARAVARSASPVATKRIQEIDAATQWPQALSGAGYGKNEPLREPLEQAIGLGLGSFDLIVIDEAHKSRGEASGLSRLLDIILAEPDARRLAMTATPVEIDASQWRQSLLRIDVQNKAWEAIEPAIAAYRQAVESVRRGWRTDEDARNTYGAAAAAFQAALSPYVMRRDKREDDAVLRFVDKTNDAEAYRSETPIGIAMGELQNGWKEAVLAAEALSFVEGGGGKRLRLTFANGHGIASRLDGMQGCAADNEQLQEDGENEPIPSVPASAIIQDNVDDPLIKQKSRQEWWQSLMTKPLASGEDVLFDHPAILAAVKAIEQHTKEGEKVLVFGRYTRPMQALTALLNARALLLVRENGGAWPESAVGAGEWSALRAAHRQLGLASDLTTLDGFLATQYKQFERRRERLRAGFFSRIRAALLEGEHEARALLNAAEAAATGGNDGSGSPVLNLLVRAVDELLPNTDSGGMQGRVHEDRELADAFVRIIGALRERTEGDTDGNEKLDKAEAENFWKTLEERLNAEYGSTRRAAFARFIYGATEHSTRRLVQLAFNRPDSFPRVLVAQSMVGREGLNLHEACRVVVLLHLEWNPGVVEQQIGRVDRVNSHWARQLEAAIENCDLPQKLPRIEVRPVIFSGTYDEYHWGVLRERWDDLRAQLHGVIVPWRDRTGVSTEMQNVIRQLDAAGPDFSPGRK